jgi:uncharacterized BrkB/YihY/UPF0761 family membrane protein
VTKRDYTLIVLLLVLASVALYAVHYAIFGSPRAELLTALDNLAFLPLQVLFVTLLISRVFAEREKQTRRDKMNMVIGTFFSAAGQQLLKSMGRLLANEGEVCSHLQLVGKKFWAGGAKGTAGCYTMHGSR